MIIVDKKIYVVPRELEHAARSVLEKIAKAKPGDLIPMNHAERKAMYEMKEIGPSDE